MCVAANSSAKLTAATIQLEPDVALTLARKMLKDKREQVPKSSGQAKYGWLDKDEHLTAEVSRLRTLARRRRRRQHLITRQHPVAKASHPQFARAPTTRPLSCSAVSVRGCQQ